MRKIIVFQALLILVGAYYIYTLQQSSAPVTELEVQSAPSQPVDEPVVATSSADTNVATTTTDVESSSEITGPSDVGMEFPIPDNEADLQQR